MKTKPVKSERLDTAWLQSEVGKYFNDASSTALGLSLEDLTTTVFDVLTSPKSDTELQNDVSMIFTLCTGTPQLLTIHLLTFEKGLLHCLLMCLKYCWMSAKQCIPRADALFCGI